MEGLSEYRCRSCGMRLAFGRQPLHLPVLYCSPQCAEADTHRYRPKTGYIPDDPIRDEVVIELVLSGASVVVAAKVVGLRPLDVTWMLKGCGLLPEPDLQARLDAQEKAEQRSPRPRGRPRADGLLPGSAEAWAADLRKRQLVKQERAAARLARRGPPKGAS